jgi:spermidine/putrescine transport system substrate-binding protein
MRNNKQQTRRRLVRAFSLPGMVVAVGLLASCGETEEVDTGLHLLEWNGYQHPQFFPEYIAKYGRAPAFTFFDNSDNAMKRMRTGYQVDLVHLCTGQLKQSKDEGLIRPIDTSRISRWADITPELLALPDVRLDGEIWIMPWEWGYSTVAYNPDAISIENPTYEMFIDPQYKGKTALTSDLVVNFLIAGVIAGWEDPLDPTGEEMQEAPAIFTKMLENARFIWTDGTQMEQAWAAGDVAISYVFGSATRRMKKEGLNNVVVYPLQTWMCGLAVTTNGKATDEEVYDYLNAMLDPASGAAMFDMYGYGHGNSTTASTMDPELIAGTGIEDPAGTFALGVYTKAHPPAIRAKLFQLWFEAQAGLN